MAGKQACSRCGVSLDDSTPDGYCPSCLLRDGLGEPGEAKPDRAGQRFGNYELLEQVGQGGMGVVYKARQLNLDRIVALKLLPFGQFSNQEVVQRFRTEAAAAAGLQHPNIVAIHDVGEHEGQHYFSMDFIEGRTLAELVRDKPLPAKRAAAYLKTIAEAIHYAHQRGILHRDLKPSNVIIDDSDQPRITDFGLAKRLDDPQLSTHSSQLTLTGQVLGSPSYIPPEQALGKAGKVSRQTDVYALGAMLYHLLTGRPPFQGQTITETLQQVLNTEPAAPRSLNPAIPRDLQTICLKCLEKEPPRRYATAEALAQDLGRFLDDKPIQARPVGVAGQAWKWCRRRPALAGMGAALVLTFALGLTGVLWQAHRARHITYAQRGVWGSGNCFYRNGQFHAVGDFRFPTKSNFNSFVLGGGTTNTWTLPPGLTLEWRAGLVRLDDNATNAAILYVGEISRGYLLHMGSRFTYILKYSASSGMSVFSCERATLRNTDVILALALTRAQSNVVITARVLDKRNPRIVLYQSTVVDTPNADPTLTTAQFEALTGMRLVDLRSDRPGLPPAKFGGLLGVFQYTDGKQPAPTAVFNKLEVRTNKPPVISSPPPP